MEVYMKKIAIIGIVILLAAFMVTCDEWLSGGKDEEVEYTDVVYSKDGSTITLYLDGKGVPFTKEQRAMSTDLATFAYDYIEVVFDAGGITARAAWELGQSAGISGIQRNNNGAPTGGVNYGFGAAAPTPPRINGDAIMMVGRKDDKTLLGVGILGDVDFSFRDNTNGGIYTPDPAGNGTTVIYPTAPVTVIFDGSRAVTFFIKAIKTGLKVTGDGATALESFTCDPEAESSRRSLGGSKISYPAYLIDEANGISPPGHTVVEGVYEFFGGAAAVGDGGYASKLFQSGNAIVQRRYPRFLDGGRYRYPPSAMDSSSFFDNLVATVNKVTFDINVIGSGLFSFYVEIPIYAVTNAPSGNGGPAHTIWKLRSGLGSELYSLDDGVSSGGCVLLGSGEVTLDWLDIYWEWVN
jgi:hypothetical protein